MQPNDLRRRQNSGRGGHLDRQAREVILANQSVANLRVDVHLTHRDDFGDQTADNRSITVQTEGQGAAESIPYVADRPNARRRIERPLLWVERKHVQADR